MYKIILIATVVLAASTCYSQNVKIPEPEFSGVIVHVNSNTGNGLPLETSKLVLKTKASASVYLTGIGKATTKAIVKGNTSSVRIPKNSIIQFIYRANDNMVNPSDVIQLIWFTTKGGNRETELASSGTFSGSSSGDIGFIQFTAEKYKTSSYLIKVKNLSAGEYGFSLGKEETTTIHMFSVE